MSYIEVLIVFYYFGLVIFGLNGLIWFGMREDNKRTVAKIRNTLYVQQKRRRGTTLGRR